MRLDFTDQIVLITGATRGIGARLAADFSAAGARLILTGTRADEIERLSAEAPTGAEYLQADFLDRGSLERFLKELGRRERIDVCVNNAGINRVDAVDAIDDADWDDVVAVNLTAPRRIVTTLAPIMKRNGYGRIVNISSIWGHAAWTERSSYASTKFGLRGLTVAAARDLAADGILVNAVSPGFTLTEMVENNYSEAERRRIEATIPLGRMAKPAELSPAVMFLANHLNTYITGATLVVDGGYLSA